MIVRRFIFCDHLQISARPPRVKGADVAVAATVGARINGHRLGVLW